MAGRCAPSEECGGLVVGQSQGGAQVLVDVRVDGDHRLAGGGQMADEQCGQRGLAAAALADEGDLHLGLPGCRVGTRKRRRRVLEIVIVTDSGMLSVVSGAACAGRADCLDRVMPGLLYRGRAGSHYPRVGEHWN
ncbi:hypothetical protein GCM10025734_41450 [Kitasatospora paranensis]